MKPIPLLVVTAACLATAAPASAAVRVVKIQDIDFSPTTLRIHRGDTVEWRFLDERTPHNVRSRGRTRFRGSETKESGTFRARFRRAGTYRYVCTIHLNMVGRIVVR
jgi:plastocyanin